MLKADNSRLLAIKRQLALYNKDYEMVRKIENIKDDSEITEEMRSYRIKETAWKKKV